MGTRTTTASSTGVPRNTKTADGWKIGSAAKTATAALGLALRKSALATTALRLNASTSPTGNAAKTATVALGAAVRKSALATTALRLNASTCPTGRFAKTATVAPGAAVRKSGLAMI